MTILEERGVFWWHDEEVPVGLLAPNSRISGRCQIEDDGRAILDLDGCLPTPDGPMEMMAGSPVTKCIQGLLKDSGERILFSDLARSGGRFSLNGTSFEKFVAMNTIVGGSPFPCGSLSPKFDILEIPLNGFENWLQLGAIKVAEGEQTISATYEKPDDLSYVCDDGKFSIEFGVTIDSSGVRSAHAFSLKESALLRLCLDDSQALSEWQTQYGMLEDLLKVLTGSDYRLDWPRVSLGGGSKWRWFFARLKSNESVPAPEFHNLVTSFSDLRGQFGAIWSRWKVMREEFGPGIYLYLGTRRGMKLYVEHRFVNLIWGLEAFHRTKYDSKGSVAIANKVERILDNITIAKDKRWLRHKLQNAHEPALEQRLLEIFAALPIGLTKEGLHAFSKACGDRRNDISHFGGQRKGGTYLEFMHDLDRKSGILSTLYHALLLHELGIGAVTLQRWLYQSFGSHEIKSDLIRSGLLNPNAAPTSGSAAPDGSIKS